MIQRLAGAGRPEAGVCSPLPGKLGRLAEPLKVCQTSRELGTVTARKSSAINVRFYEPLRLATGRHRIPIGGTKRNILGHGFQMGVSQLSEKFTKVTKFSK